MNIFKKIVNTFKDTDEVCDPFKKFTVKVYDRKTEAFLGETTMDYYEFKEKVAWDTKYIYRRKNEDD